MRCAVCQAENPASAKFCIECGTPAALRCEGCGAELPARAKFCMECGQPVAGAAVARDARAEERSYTPKHLADKILRSKGAMEGERKQVSVLFADVTESMALADQVDVEVWHRILDDFFAILTSGVHRYEGTINQYTGDGVMALFGAPIAHEDHAQRACYAALRILDEMETFADEMRRRHGLNFSVRLGINSGEVVVGKIGDDLRMDYTAQGHTVGLAARVEALAAPNTANVTDHTAKLVAGYLSLDDLGEFSLKGVREPLRVWRLEGLGQARTRLDVSRARGLSRFVGRRSEIARLEEALKRARNGERQVIGVFGDAGAGKSRLCAEFLERGRREGIATYEAHCVAHGEMIPFLPALELLRAYTGLNEREDPRTQREKIAGRLLLIDPKMADELSLVFDFMGIGDPANPAPSLDPQIRSRILFEHLKVLLDSVASKNPSIVMWEDLHWIDGGSDGFLAEYIALTAGMPVLVIANSRPGYRAAWMDEPYYTEIQVGPLRRDEVREMLVELVGNDASVVPIADRIADRTAGNPFFVEEVVRSLEEAGTLVGKRGSYVAVKGEREIALPATVHAVLAARIDRLADGDKRLLETASVIGKRFDEPLLRKITGLDDEQLQAGLGRLSDGGFIAQEDVYPDPEYVFQHPLTQEVAYRTQLAETRAAVHRRVAEELEQSCACGEGRDELAGLLAHHWEGAGDILHAVAWRKRAAEWAASRDLREAERHWLSVCDLLSRCDECPQSRELAMTAREALIEIGWKLGRPLDSAERWYSEAVTLAERGGDIEFEVRMAAALAMAELFAGKVERGLERIAQASQKIESVGSRELSVRIDGRVAYMNILSGRVSEALAVMDRVVAARANGVPTESGAGEWFAAFRALPLAYLGRLDEAGQAVDVTMAKLRAMHDPAGLASVCGLGVTVAWFRGDPIGAIEHAQEQVRIAERLRTPALLASAYDSLGVASLLAERFHDALELAERALNVARKSGTLLQSEAVFIANLAAAHVGVGELTRGIECARESVAIARERYTPLFECRALLVCVRALLAGGPEHLDEAESLLHAAFAIVERTNARGYEPFLRVEASRLARLRGDAAAGDSELAEASRQFDQMGATGHAERLVAAEARPAS